VGADCEREPVMTHARAEENLTGPRFPVIGSHGFARDKARVGRPTKSQRRSGTLREVKCVEDFWTGSLALGRFG
jgi:hypothetical protein